MKKIIIINTSPRRGGNSDVIADKLAAEIKNAEIEVFRLRDKKVNPCMACNACKHKDTPFCVQKDDFSALIPSLDGCDSVVLLSPIYFGTINGPAKTLVDRLYCFFNPTKPNASIASKRGKKCAVICCCGAGPTDVYSKGAGDQVKSFSVAGADEFKAYTCGGVNEPGSCKNNAKDMQAVSDIAAWLSK
jgi:multimeric flavodoxin WrbA